MPPLVLLEAGFCAILHSLACAFDFKYLFLSAEFALADVDTLVADKFEGERATILVILNLHDNV